MRPCVSPHADLEELHSLIIYYCCPGHGRHLLKGISCGLKSSYTKCMYSKTDHVTYAYNVHISHSLNKYTSMETVSVVANKKVSQSDHEDPDALKYHAYAMMGLHIISMYNMQNICTLCHFLRVHCAQ